MKATVVNAGRVVTLCSLLVFPHAVKADQVDLAALKSPAGLKVKLLNEASMAQVPQDSLRKAELQRQMNQMMLSLVEDEAVRVAHMKGPNVKALRISLNDLKEAYITQDKEQIHRAQYGYLKALLLVDRSRKGLLFSAWMSSICMASLLFLRPQKFIDNVDTRIARSQGIPHLVRAELDAHLTGKEVGFLTRLYRGVRILSYLAHNDTDKRSENSQAILSKYKMFVTGAITSAAAMVYGLSQCAASDLGCTIGTAASWAIGIAGLFINFYSPLYRSAARAVDAYCTARIRTDSAPVGK